MNCFNKVSLSLSLSIYIYIYMCVCVCVCVCITHQILNNYKSQEIKVLKCQFDLVFMIKEPIKPIKLVLRFLNQIDLYNY